MDVGSRIHNIIDDLDMKQAELAKRLDIPLSTLNGYMTGRHQFPLDVIRAVAKELNVTADYLLGMCKEPERPVRLTKAEQGLVEGYRMLTRDQRELIVKNIAIMQEQNRK